MTAVAAMNELGLKKSTFYKLAASMRRGQKNSAVGSKAIGAVFTGLNLCLILIVLKVKPEDCFIGASGRTVKGC